MQRRVFIGGLGGVVLAAGPQRRASATDPGSTIVAPHLALAAVVAAIAGPHLTVATDPNLPIASIKFDGGSVSLASRLLLKGDSNTRRQYLDDARNAPKLGASIRDTLGKQWPQHRKSFERNHREWSHTLVRAILKWTSQLANAKLRNKRIYDPGGRRYLLEWAGAIVTDDGAPAPGRLAQAAIQPSAATPRAYREYIQQLVDAVR